MKKQEELEILRTIDRKKDSSQRELARELGFSLGKLKDFLKLKILKKIKKKLGIFT